MVEIHVENNNLLVEVLGAHKLWAFKSKIEVPLSAVQDFRVRPDTKVGWWHGVRLPGTHLPGVIVAGSYLNNGKWSFWDVSNGNNTLEILVDGHRYHKIIVEVADPQASMRLLEQALS